jgi:hypothetical protein
VTVRAAPATNHTGFYSLRVCGRADQLLCFLTRTSHLSNAYCRRERQRLSVRSMKMNVHQVSASSPRFPSKWTERCAHRPGPPTRVLGKVTLALVLAIPVMLLFMVLFGVLLTRGSASSLIPGDSMSSCPFHH